MSLDIDTEEGLLGFSKIEQTNELAIITARKAYYLKEEQIKQLIEFLKENYKLKQYESIVRKTSLMG
jgi:hypothetical protein